MRTLAISLQQFSLHKKSHIFYSFLQTFHVHLQIIAFLLSVSLTSRDSFGKVFAIFFSFCCNTVAFSFKEMQGTSVDLPSFTPYFYRHSWQTCRLLLVNIPFLISSSKRHREHFWAIISCNFDLFSVWESHVQSFFQWLEFRVFLVSMMIAK